MVTIKAEAGLNISLTEKSVEFVDAIEEKVLFEFATLPDHVAFLENFPIQWYFKFSGEQEYQNGPVTYHTLFIIDAIP